MAFRGERLFPIEEVFIPYDTPTGKFFDGQPDDLHSQIDGQLQLDPPLVMTPVGISPSGFGTIVNVELSWDAYNKTGSKDGGK